MINSTKAPSLYMYLHVLSTSSIRRPVSSEQAIPRRRKPPVLNHSLLRSQLQITPVSSMHSRDKSHQSPIRTKRAAMTLPFALAASPPKKNVGTATRPRSEEH